MTPATYIREVMGRRHSLVPITLAAIIALAGCSNGNNDLTTSTQANTTNSTAPTTVADVNDPASDLTITTSTTSAPGVPTTTAIPTIEWTPPEVCAPRDCDSHDVLAIVPAVFAGRDGDIGGDGVTYFRHDVPLWGPAALIVDQTGAFWIADAAAFDGPRLIRVSEDGNGVEFVTFEGTQLGGILDVASVTEGLAILNVAGEVGASVEIVDHRGTVTNQIPLPEQDFGISSGISGLATTPDGQLLVEMEGGARTASVDMSTGAYSFHIGYYTDAGSYMFAYPPPGATETVFRAPGADIPIAAPDSLGSLAVIGVNPDGSFVISVDWMSFADSEIVDGGRQLLWYNADGTLQGIAEFPITEQAVHVEHPVVLATDGYLYGLLTRPEHVEIVRLNYRAPE